jgi:hypothetical protein
MKTGSLIMKKNKKHHFGLTTLGNWNDLEVITGNETQNLRPQTEENTPIRRADNLIYEDVWESLYQAAEVDASEVEVNVSEGSVILKGFISSRHGRHRASSIIREIAGVLDVKNLLWIKNPLGLISPEEDDKYNIKVTRGLINNHTGLY